MRKLLTALFTFGVIFISAGQSLNQYKYILIPETYEFTGEVDQYRLNSMTKFLFEKEGFNTLMKTEDKPADLKQNPCLGITTKLENNSGIFVTKLVLKLEDCYGNVVFTSKEGRSREKDFEVAFQEALREAFESIKKLDYLYDSSASISANIPQPKQVEIEEEPEAEEEVEEDIQEIIEEESEIILEEDTESYESEEGVNRYRYAGKIYSLNETEEGYGLYQENASEPIAILIETEGGKSFIYNSLTNQGIAYFDSQDNLIVEYFSRQENKKVLVKYELVD
ncbi:hypothetical protein NE848_00265 [Gramella jeungdoensis]|uniref:Uncharacterized protein n=1 Tax=Gramella jeungdoensis TaxID=708091 RepID=A0ABT0YWF8_9FLAO|nr:hypothetical protein [Gramella jeungdoensis]MCM8567796.1 hypothetical protein [Gramella jeungdoensis]